jgi:hypothetical protein
LAGTCALLIAGLFPAGAGAVPPPERVDFSASTLFPQFEPSIRDYVVRCPGRQVRVQAQVSGDWQAAVGRHAYRRGDFSVVVPLNPGQAFKITVRRASRPRQLYRYHVRCLPSSFPAYSFTRYGPVSPRHFSVDHAFTSTRAERYGIIFDNHGVPVWWIQSPTWDTRVLPSGNVLWFDQALSPGRWAVHPLGGGIVRTFNGVRRGANGHDLQRLANGDYLIGAYVKQEHVDTSAHGGSSDATVVNAELQQVSPERELVWNWRTRDHISLAETGRFWPGVAHPGPKGYDIVHWNSIEPVGGSVIASFRNVDAVYRIRKSTGEILWKLGGTDTPESLEVLNDPKTYTFGAQHDARLLPGGSLTVFDNRSRLADNKPRAVRFRLDQAAGTATLLESVTDPAVTHSSCCGSARRLGNGHWLIGWGRSAASTGLIGGYEPGGQRTFTLRFADGFSYRAEPVPPDVLAPQDLRRAMDAMYRAR